MALNTDTIALISVVIGFVGMAWAVFWPVRELPGSHPVSTHWDIVYVDDDGIMQFTLVRVIKVNPGTRRMTAWCATAGAERIFKLGKIVKATDVRSGARINVARLMDKPRPVAGPDQLDPVAQGRAHDPVQVVDAGGWWRASRLGLR